MWAGSLTHNGLTGCGNDGGDFSSHLLEHETGGMFDVTHGAGLAAVWPSWARYVYKDCLPRFVRYARNVMQVELGATDEETALKGIAAMEAFYHRIGMPINMKELGVKYRDHVCGLETEGYILFDNGYRLYALHLRDCCEDSYPDWEILSYYNVNPVTEEHIRLQDIDLQYDQIYLGCHSEAKDFDVDAYRKGAILYGKTQI